MRLGQFGYKVVQKDGQVMLRRLAGEEADVGIAALEIHVRAGRGIALR